MTGQAVDSGVLVGTKHINLIVSVNYPAWLHSKLGCRTSNSETFFPETYNLMCRDQIQQARDICNACPVKARCLEWALERPCLEGIWAATTPLERRRIRKQRKELLSA